MSFLIKNWTVEKKIKGIKKTISVLAKNYAKKFHKNMSILNKYETGCQGFYHGPKSTLDFGSKLPKIRRDRAKTFLLQVFMSKKGPDAFWTPNLQFCYDLY